MDGGEKIIADIKKILAKIRSNVPQKELDYFLIHRNRYQFILQKILDLKLPRESKVLDIGCYPPHLFTALKEFGFSVWGISSKHELVLSDHVINVNIESDKLPMPPNSFDLIIISEVIEHLLLNPRLYLEKIKKVLKPKGVMIITTPNAVNLKNRFRLLVGKNIYFSLEQLEESKDLQKSIYFRHNREFTKEELEKVIKKAGFKIKELMLFNSYSPFRKKRISDPILIKIGKIGGFFLTYLLPQVKDTIFLQAVLSKKMK